MDRLLTHVFIDLFYGRNRGLLIKEELYRDEKRKLLLERYGVFDGCEEIAYRLSDVMFIGNYISDGTTSSEGTNCHFLFDVIGVVDDSLNEKAYYNPSETVLSSDGTFKEIKIHINSDKIKNYSDLYINIMHELTHAKQDYDLRLKGMSLNTEGERVGYNKHAGVSIDEPVDKVMVSKYLYFLNQYEKGAYVSMLKGRLNKASGISFSSIDEVIRYLKDTEEYKVYSMLKKYTPMFCGKDIPHERKSEIVKIANRISNYNFRTFNDFSRWRITRLNKVLNKMDRIIPRIATEYLKMNIFMGNANTLEENINYFENVIEKCLS